jgi:quinolinate synthase
MVVYDPRQRYGGLSPEQIQAAKVILWYGFCSVHQGFTSDQIKMWREKEADRILIVHPECSFDVVQGSDLAGSTSFIINQIKAAKDGTKFAIGTRGKPMRRRETPAARMWELIKNTDS